MMSDDEISHEMSVRLPADTPDPGTDLLVPFDGSRGAEKVLRRACRAARRDSMGLAVLCVVKLPAEVADGLDDDRLDDTAMQALTQAQVICRDEGVVGAFKLCHDRSLAHAILAEARRSNAVLIGLSLREHASGESALMSETVQTVLAFAPCAVLLDDPATELLPARHD